MYRHVHESQNERETFLVAAIKHCSTLYGLVCVLWREIFFLESKRKGTNVET